MILFCWTFPRTRSTILEKCVSGFVKTLHEPFSGMHYASVGGDVSMSQTHILTNFDHVIESILEAEKIHGNVFVKELAYCVFRHDEFLQHKDFWTQCKHVILTRHPTETIPSLCKQMFRVYGQDCPVDRIRQAIGVKDLMNLATQLSEWKCEPLTRLDSHLLIENPRQIISDICAIFDIQYNDAFLEWKAGSLPDWQIWEVSGWHDKAKETTSFVKTEEKDDEKSDSEKKHVYDILTKETMVDYSLLHESL